MRTGAEKSIWAFMPICVHCGAMLSVLSVRSWALAQGRPFEGAKGLPDGWMARGPSIRQSCATRSGRTPMAVKWAFWVPKWAFYVASGRTRSWKDPDGRKVGFQAHFTKPAGGRALYGDSSPPQEC